MFEFILNTGAKKFWGGRFREVHIGALGGVLADGGDVGSGLKRLEQSRSGSNGGGDESNGWLCRLGGNGSDFCTGDGSGVLCLPGEGEERGVGLLDPAANGPFNSFLPDSKLLTELP